jgi:DNA-binding response OmpR family regulator
MGRRVLVVEDEPELQLILSDNLEFEGYEVMAVDTGERALELSRRFRPDLVLLDVMLPNMNGYDTCRTIRAAGLQMPIIMLTVRNAELERIAGLDCGADDYMGKPFSIGELMARVRVQLRRSSRAQPVPGMSEFTFGKFRVDFEHRIVYRASERIPMSDREFELLQYFIVHKGQLVTREQLLTDVWGYERGSASRTVDNFVAKLRKRFVGAQDRPYIVTMHGTGYRFVA